MSTTRSGMRLLRVVLLLLLVTAVLSLEIALVSAETGLAEKVVLVGLIGGCLVRRGSCADLFRQAPGATPPSLNLRLPLSGTAA